ncbi:hypothetical protein W97_07599 [Coniosporium apollinis CBS 100218]|uniref:Peptidase M48 domain-containing protein n=1 Tax=Coniosporium apollinis (strain CBS 100218) TaxID=1168221 RepID=R7Z331_CONA1|nr:uncharacterized protein W97_07599 [Coniosporium apollinis CBS 100218]EON68341.1 hypothetical protein W97_07599 [Coniosporium apollinis CBS 100218]
MFAARPLRAFPSSAPSQLLRPRPVLKPKPIVQPRTQVRHQYYRYNQRYQRFQASKNLFRRWVNRPTFKYEAGGLGAAAGGFYVYNLEVVPVSGRRRFNIFGPETEQEMSKAFYSQIMQEYRDRILPDWDKRSRMVRRVLDRLIPATGLEDSNWEVHVIEDEQRNAFVIPGGKVFVFSGILPVCANDDGLAAVLGHEIAHNFAHHSAERLSKAIIIYALIFGLELFVGAPGQISQLLLDLVFTRPGSRGQESEADYIGLMMMAQSCYNPEEAAALWGRMAQVEEKQGGAPPQYLSTHPSSHNRQEKIREWLPEAKEKQALSDCASTLDYAHAFKRAFGGEYTW